MTGEKWPKKVENVNCFFFVITLETIFPLAIVTVRMNRENMVKSTLDIMNFHEKKNIDHIILERTLTMLFFQAEIISFVNT